MQVENAVDSQMYPPVEASGGQEKYYIWSALHLFAHFMFSCCRGKSLHLNMNRRYDLLNIEQFM